jgi:hypothetical protein
MGRNTVSIEVTARLSAHNSEQDDIDLQAWERFVAAVRELAEREDFRDIGVDVH